MGDLSRRCFLRRSSAGLISVMVAGSAIASDEELRRQADRAVQEALAELNQPKHISPPIATDPKLPAKPAKQRTVHHAPSGYRPRWSWPGNAIHDPNRIVNLNQHLVRTHGINTAGMTAADLMAAHDAAHEGARFRLFNSQVQSNSNCPGGVCPTPRHRRR